MYQTAHTSRSEFVPIRQLSYHVRLWGPETSSLPPLVLVHGWMDVAASYQFVVDAFGAAFMQGRRIIAPDWRGFGQTAPPSPTDHYFFPDYLADLDQLLDHYAGDTPVDLVGHSMGGSVVMFYAGARPGRIRRLVNLEGFGMPDNQPAKAPARYAEWMDQLKALQRGEMALKTYDSVDGVARRLMKTNPVSRKTRPTGWPRTGPSPMPRGNGTSWAMRRTRSPTHSCFAWKRRWPTTPPSPRPPWPSKPATTAWGCGGKAGTRWSSTTSGSSRYLTAAPPWCKTPVTCCTTTSRRPWRL